MSKWKKYSTNGNVITPRTFKKKKEFPFLLKASVYVIFVLIIMKITLIIGGSR